MRNAPKWLRVFVAVAVIFSGALSMLANYLTIKEYSDKKATVSKEV